MQPNMRRSSRVTPDEALRRLKAQEASVAATDAIAREFAARLAGISIEHSPDFRIVVLLTGTDAVADRSAAGVPIVFRTGAKATHAQALQALRKHLIDLRADLPERARRRVRPAHRRSRAAGHPADAEPARDRTRSAPAPSRSAEFRSGWSSTSSTNPT